MSEVGQPERYTQDRIVKLFIEKLDYTYLGNWADRLDNKNIEEEYLRAYLESKRYAPELINRAIDKLVTESKNYDRNLYQNNKEVYNLLRFGAKVKVEVGNNYETIEFIDWKNPAKNKFYIAEEVTILGNREKRPDIVLYINGIAIGVLEVKRSIVSVREGIGQNIVNQRSEFIGSFFSTIQFVFAGNDTEGLRYGTVGTSEKFFMNWKEDEDDNSLLKLDKYLIKICNKERIIELMFNFVLFDGGTKKLPRPHQYFGIKAAQDYVRRREGGIVWHTQGSGKSIVMVLLAKWILENNPNARVVVLTDRDELDKQIKRVFKDAGEDIYRTKSSKDLFTQLEYATPRLICSLVHKFGKKDIENFQHYIEELKNNPPRVTGEIFVLVDECHRTQSGKLHKTMKAVLQHAVFIGFTGTPLLKQDKQTSLEVFGNYIHTYKFNEAVEDQVILDLVYEARDIDQRITSHDKIDKWFEAKTKGLNDFQKFELKKKWGTMQKVLSSLSRMNKVVADIVFDFSVKPRLNQDTGNAILVASRIYEACKYYKLFQDTELKGKVGIVTSYSPNLSDITTEDTGANTETEKEFIYNLYQEVLKNKKNTEKYEEGVKELFLEEPANMQLLIVVDKLLTGFDAPSCTYLYIDQSMQDHKLFQAICRVNRLDTEDKEYGYIIDYKDLFRNLVNEDGTGAIQVYTSELDYDKFKKEDCDVLMKNRLQIGKERLDAALNAIAMLCEPVTPPKSLLEYQHYFCGNTEIEDELKATEIRRNALYKATVSLIRAYANIADELHETGYSDEDIEDIKKEVDFYLKLREEIRIASGEKIDLKTYEADMRHLIDNYIQAEDPREISKFGNQSILEIIEKVGILQTIESLPEDIRTNKDAVAETIENNVRQKIITDYLTSPIFFEEMSKLLQEIIKERKAKAIDYEEYLAQITALVIDVNNGKKDDTPKSLKTKAQLALYNSLEHNEELANKIHEKILRIKPDGWKGNDTKEKVIKGGLFEILKNESEVERIFEIIKAQAEY
ncbi:type I restriction endonuclease subunit R [Dysgonomonas capnocytophagoides]|uniref:type I restriction endonuclease subunit R n=1 Tax=Dysgonomonas capnocytophagoides TaxID=45254 RepID=UPI0039922CF1